MHSGSKQKEEARRSAEAFVGIAWSACGRFFCFMYLHFVLTSFLARLCKEQRGSLAAAAAHTR